MAQPSIFPLATTTGVNSPIGYSTSSVNSVVSPTLPGQKKAEVVSTRSFISNESLIKRLDLSFSHRPSTLKNKTKIPDRIKQSK